jgi:hypothetical protein
MRKNKCALFFVCFVFVAGYLFSNGPNLVDTEVLKLMHAEGIRLIDTEDTGNRGKINRWIYIKPDGGLVIKSDTNYKNMVDYLLETDKDGNKVFEALDFNHDGKMDNFYYYKRGILERQEIDSNYDGKVDVWVYLDQGVYVARIERDTKHNGTIDYVKKYR